MPTWTEFEATLPPQIPDAARDALRDRFFSENVAPGLVRKGADLAQAKARFFELTQRQDRAANPRLEAGLASAANALVAPLEGAMHRLAGQPRVVEQTKQDVLAEAQRQGVNTAIPEFIGTGAGSAPYWLPFMRAARMAGAAGGMSPLVADVLGGAAAQGSYEALASRPGEALSAGLTGAALGAGGVLAFEGLPKLARKFFARHDTPLAPEVPTPVEVPVVTEAEDPHGISLLMPNGQPYELSAAVIRKDPTRATDLVKQAVARGAKVQTVTGPEDFVTSVLRQTDNVVDDLPKTVRGAELDNTVILEPTTRQQAFEAREDLARQELAASLLATPSRESRMAAFHDAASRRAANVTLPTVPSSTTAPYATRPVEERAAARLATPPPETPPTRESRMAEFYARARQRASEVNIQQPTVRTERHFEITSQEERAAARLASRELPQPEPTNLAPLKLVISGGGKTVDLSGITPADYAKVAPQVKELLAAGGRITEIENGSEFMRVMSGVDATTTKPRAAVTETPAEFAARLVTARSSGEVLPQIDDVVNAVQKRFGVAEADALVATSTAVRAQIGDIARRELGAVNAEAIADVATDWAPQRVQAAIKSLASMHEYAENAGVGTVAALRGPEGGKLVSVLERAFDSSRDVRVAALNELAAKWPEVFENVSVAVAGRRSGVLRKIGFEDMPLTDKLRRTPNGRVLDLEHGVLYKDEATALAARGQLKSMTVTDAPPQTAGVPQLHPGAIDRITGAPLPNTVAGATSISRGGRVTIRYADDLPGRPTITHENTHAKMAYTGISDTVADEVATSDMGKQLVNAFSPDVVRNAARSGSKGLHEEVFTYLQQAIRHRNDPHSEALMRAFVDADGDELSVYKFAADMTRKAREALDAQPDSPIKRQLQRQFDNVLQRAGTRMEVQATLDGVGLTTRVGEAGKWELTLPDGAAKVFDSRDAMATWVEQNMAAPLNAPELVSLAEVPDEILKFASRQPVRNSGRGAVNMAPASMPQNMQKKLVVGSNVFGYFLRPWTNWIDNVATSSDWPELGELVRKIGTASKDLTHFIQGEVHPKLSATFGAMDDATKAGALDYLMATDRVAAQRALHLTTEQTAKLDLLGNMLDTLPAQYNKYPFSDWLKYARQTRGKPFDPKAPPTVYGLTDDAVTQFRRMQEIGQLDPNITDIVRAADAYVTHSARNTALGADLDQLARMARLKNADGEYVMGALKPLIERHIEYMQHRPDSTAQAIQAAWGEAVYKLNGLITKANTVLPKSMQLEVIEPQQHGDALGRFMLFSYAGALGYRPMAWLRDSLQIFMTSYPVLGGKYLMRGISDSMKLGKDGWAEAQRYGALLEHNPLQNLYAQDATSLSSGKLTKFAEHSLKPMTTMNNINRLATWHGHVAMGDDAAKAFASHGDVAKLAVDSGAVWLPEGVRAQYIQALAAARGNAATTADVVRKMATELTDVSQWNYRRGETPGMYKYAMGRLFGQYGTWPLNYVEYMRTVWGQKGTAHGRAAIARIAAAHGAVLGAAQTFGIDAANWVFTGPAQFSGGPLFQATINLPKAALDWESQRGAEARRTVTSPLWPLGVPGGLAIENVYKAITDPKLTNDWDRLIKAVGFQPLRSGEASRGIHQAFPEPLFGGESN